MAAAIFTAVPAQGQGPPKGALESLLHNLSTGRRSKAFVAARRARNAKGKAIKRELKSIET